MNDDGMRAERDELREALRDCVISMGLRLEEAQRRGEELIARHETAQPAPVSSGHVPPPSNGYCDVCGGKGGK